MIELSPYVGLFVTLCLAGILPIPEEPVIMTAGVLAHQGIVQAWLALPVCLVGVLVGDVILYWTGHHWGHRVLQLPTMRYLITPRRSEALAASYRRHGIWIVFAARHVLGLRAAAFLIAGIVRVPFRKFLAADGVAAGLSIPLNFGLAYLFTDQVYRLFAEVHRTELWVGLLALVAVVAWLGLASWRRNRRLLIGDERGEEPAERRSL